MSCIYFINIYNDFIIKNRKLLVLCFYIFCFLSLIILLVNFRYMSKKWIFTLIAWYLAWSVVASVFSKKKWSDLKKDLKKVKWSKEDTFKLLLDNFIDTHKNLLDSIKDEIVSEKNKELFNSKKKELVALLEDYKKQWEKMLKNLKSEGGDVIAIGKEKIEKLYLEKKEKIEELVWEAPEVANELKEKLLVSFNDFKNKLKK